MTMTKDDLLNLKKDIEVAKENVSELRGQKKGLMKQLNKDWNCKTLEEAQEKLDEIDKEIADLDAKIKKQIQAIEKEFDEEFENVDD